MLSVSSKGENIEGKGENASFPSSLQVWILWHRVNIFPDDKFFTLPN